MTTTYTVITENPEDLRAVPGMTYVYYKTGDHYIVEDLVYSSSDLAVLVTYRNADGIKFCRPLNTPGKKSWCDEVPAGNGTVTTRFRPLTLEDLQEKSND